ncbi:MAG: alpha/beta hydrolase [Candidatus Marinimicrobia bacterium]|nr:alpha/beta hydrolase [Candidatus Neomarinimicrobiota bacterium]
MNNFNIPHRELLEIRPGRRIFIQTIGSDSETMIMLIHGAGGRGEQWHYQIAELQKKYFVVIPDLLGHGNSPVPRTGYTFSELAADMEAVYSSYQRRRNVVIGHSYGMAFTLWLAGRFKGEIERAVLIGAAPLRTSSTSSIWNLPNIVLRLLRPMLSKNFAAGAFHPDTDPEFVKKERASSDKNPMWMMKALFNGMRYDGEKNLANLSIPIRIINGEADKFTTVALGQKLAKELPRGEFFEVKQASHLVMMEQPKQVNRLILDFIPIS